MNKNMLHIEEKFVNSNFLCMQKECPHYMYTCRLLLHIQQLCYMTLNITLIWWQRKVTFPFCEENINYHNFESLRYRS